MPQPPAVNVSAPAARRAWVALGANLGDAAATLARAIVALGKVEGIRVDAVSSVRVTAPVGPPQPDYHNAVVRVVTHLAPHALLDALLTIERSFHRRREVTWGPRTLDLDLVLYGDHGERVVELPELTLPHPHMHARRFVLDPLLELDPALIHPRTGRSLAEHRDALISASPLL